MTFLHFINCVALTFAPSFIVYQATKISEFRALSLCVWGGIAYAVTQLIKMILLATFLPTSETQTLQPFDLTIELLRTIANFGDILGAYFILSYLGGSYGDLKLLGVGLGWSTTEALLVRLAPLWIGARTLEFSWIYIQTSIEANINLVLYMGFMTCVWLWSRKKLDRKLIPPIVLSLVIYSSIPLITNYLKYSQNMGSWTVLSIEAIIVFVLGITSRFFYQSFSSSLVSH